MSGKEMNRSVIIGKMLLLGAVVMFTSCMTDEVDDVNLLANSGRELRFTATQSQEDADKFTRSVEAEESEEAPELAIYEVEGDEDMEKPLYLHMVSEEREDVPADEVYAAEADEYADEAITRGAPVTSADSFISTYKSRGFGLFAYVYKPGEWDAASTTSEYIHNIPVIYRSASEYQYWSINDPTSHPQYHWPGANYNIRFYAYAPYAGSSNYYTGVITVDEKAYKGVPVLGYTVSSANLSGVTNTNHPDFLIAKAESENGKDIPGDKNSIMKLEFKHAMSAVSFKVGKGLPAGTITSIMVTGVYRKAKINLSTQKWSNYENIGPVQLAHKDESGKSVAKPVEITGAEGEQITKVDETFMMLPQTLPADATISVKFVDKAGNAYTLSGKIGGREWKMGYHYTYTISTEIETNYEFKVTTTMPQTNSQYTLEDDYMGGATTSWTITSYKTVSSKLSQAKKEAVSWKAQAYINNKWVDITTKPNMFSKFTNSGTGSVTAQTFNAEMATIVPDDPWNPFGQPAERDAELVEVVDLYNDVSGGSTANCYVINQAGTYSFPLFYGNAMKDHQANPSAYEGNSFVDYNGASIVNPNISIPSTACAKLLWCDAPQLVTDVELSANTVNYDEYSVRTIKFRVPRENITPGNAVIALYNKDGGTIMWSWHIWVTTWNPNITPNTEVPEVKNSDGSIRIARRKHSVAVESYNKTFYFATEILGYCPSRKATWNERNIKIRFVQVDNGVEIEGKVSAEYYFCQTSNSINQQYGEGNMPYYQWGRKDPLLPYHYLTDASGISTVGEEKFCYSANFTKFTFGIVKIYGTLKTNNVLTGKSIKESIQNPHVFYPRYRNSPATMNDGSEYDWCNDDFPAQYSRWDSGNTSYTSVNDIKTQKTIYDPCPVGWCVPPAGAWHGILHDGGATGGHYISETATYYPNDKTKSYSISGLVTPITGDRNRYLGTPWVDTKNARPCEFWTSGTNIGTGADGVDYSGCGYMVISSGTSYTLSLLGMSSGFAVLPVKEH